MRRFNPHEHSRNVLGEKLQSCSEEPLTGFYRDGCCNVGPDDLGVHAVCVRLTAEFLEFSKARGNDLSTPMPQFGFAGLKPGDQWCLCAARWKEAFDANAAPRVNTSSNERSGLTPSNRSALAKPRSRSTSSGFNP